MEFHVMEADRKNCRAQPGSCTPDASFQNVGQRFRQRTASQIKAGLCPTIEDNDASVTAVAERSTLCQAGSLRSFNSGPATEIDISLHARNLTRIYVLRMFMMKNVNKQAYIVTTLLSLSSLQSFLRQSL
jgi:hypothetical protein